MSREQGPHLYLLLLSLGPLLKAKVCIAVITEDKDGGVTRRKAEENARLTISSLLPIPENEKSVLTILLARRGPYYLWLIPHV